jgi:hypothetical protein
MTPDITMSANEVTRTSETGLPSSKILRNNAGKQSVKNINEISWPMFVLHAYINLAGLYGAYLMLTSGKMLTGVWGMYTRYVCMSDTE